MTTKQLSEHSLLLSTAVQSDQLYTALKNSILTAVADDSKTNWIDALSKIRYHSSSEKPSSLMAQMISTCMNPEQDQGTHDLVALSFNYILKIYKTFLKPKILISCMTWEILLIDIIIKYTVVIFMIWHQPKMKLHS